MCQSQRKAIMTNLDSEQAKFTHMNEVIRSHGKVEPPLPFTHTCTSKKFRAMLTGERIALHECKILNRPLIYLFYGRPAYRVNDAEDATTNDELYPVVLIISNNTEVSVKQIFPFDTGAFQGGLYKDFISHGNSVFDYELEANFDFIGRFISYMYGKNVNYFDGKPKRKAEDISHFGFELRNLLNMMNFKGNSKWDCRGLTIELQCDNDISFRKATILAIVAPRDFASVESFTKFAYDKKIKFIPYSTMRARPSEFTTAIIPAVKRFLKGEQLL
jgi:hypothetical protein